MELGKYQLLGWCIAMARFYAHYRYIHMYIMFLLYELLVAGSKYWMLNLSGHALMLVILCQSPRARLQKPLNQADKRQRPESAN